MARWWARGVKQLGSAFGLRVERAGPVLLGIGNHPRHAVHSTGMHEWLLADMIRLLVDQEGVDLVVDVGANEGQFAELVRRHGFRGRILSFEPNPASAEALRVRAAGDALWQVVESALGAAQGRAVLHVSPASEFSSLSVGSAEGIELFPDSLNNTKAVEVEVQRLDSVAHDWIRDATVVLLKIDTQGHDSLVLAGASALLAKCQIVLRELAVVAIYEGVEVFEESVAQLRALGYTPVGFYPVVRNPRLGLVEIDGLFARP